MIRESIEGALAGAAATVPMTAFMKYGHDQLPSPQQYALPPRQITRRVGKVLGIWHGATKTQKNAATLAAHFSYGSAMGALYRVGMPRKHQNLCSGAGYGLAVWAGSYLGLLPALGILPPATQHPVERNALMIAAHVMWGMALAVSLSQVSTDAE